MKQTSDVYFAAVLLALGYKLDSTDRTDPKHMKFTFVGKPVGNLGEIQKAVTQETMNALENAWANRSIVVNAFDYSEAIKRMKSHIHNS